MPRKVEKAANAANNTNPKPPNTRKPRIYFPKLAGSPLQAPAVWFAEKVLDYVRREKDREAQTTK